MLCKPDEILKFHGKLSAAMAKSVVGPTVIEQYPEFRSTEKWKKSHYEGSVSFFLWSPDQRMQAWDRESSRQIHQLRDVQSDTGCGWVYWHEEWTLESGDSEY